MHMTTTAPAFHGQTIRHRLNGKIVVATVVAVHSRQLANGETYWSVDVVTEDSNRPYGLWVGAILKEGA
jgi:hypothetical protein